MATFGSVYEREVIPSCNGKEGIIGNLVLNFSELETNSKKHALVSALVKKEQRRLTEEAVYRKAA